MDGPPGSSHRIKASGARCDVGLHDRRATEGATDGFRRRSAARVSEVREAREVEARPRRVQVPERRSEARLAARRTHKLLGVIAGFT